MSPLALPTQSITASSRVPAGSLQCQGRVPRTVDALRAVGLEAFVAFPSGRQPISSGTVARAGALLPAECRELVADTEGISI